MSYPTVEAGQLDFYQRAGKSDGDPIVEARQHDFYQRAGKSDGKQYSRGFIA